MAPISKRQKTGRLNAAKRKTKPSTISLKGAWINVILSCLYIYMKEYRSRFCFCVCETCMILPLCVAYIYMLCRAEVSFADTIRHCQGCSGHIEAASASSEVSFEADV